jgi:hypothetical protein
MKKQPTLPQQISLSMANSQGLEARSDSASSSQFNRRLTGFSVEN